MASHKDRESFIPFRRADIIRLCLSEGKLEPQHKHSFKAFCEILSAYYHHDFHQILESLKDNFSHLDPDADTKTLDFLADTEAFQDMIHNAMEDNEDDLIAQFKEVLYRANYTELSPEELEKAFKAESLIKLDMRIDFEEYEDVLFYYRGDSMMQAEIKQFFRKKNIELDVYERVVLLLKFKDEDYFRNKNQDISKLNFTPGKMYIYLYKNIPKLDLEALFPNVEAHMTWKDKLMFVVPAVGAGVPVALKALPQLLLILGIIVYFSIGPHVSDQLGVGHQHVNNFLPILVALMSLVVIFGGFAVKQFLNYKNKKLKFLKDVTETLFFRNIVCNSGVFSSLIDSAEEEECKEAILAYYHLLTHPEGMTKEQLDDHIEEWFEKKFDTKVDFHVEKALHKLKRMRGLVNQENDDILALAREGNNGVFTVLPLDQAQTVIDYVWDNVFKYNSVLE